MEELTTEATSRTVAPTPVASDGIPQSTAVQRLRACAELVAAGQAGLLTVAAAVLIDCDLQLPTTGLRVADRAVFVRDLATAEVACATGTSEHEAAGLVALAERLMTVMPCALTALREGRLDLRRVRLLADLTAVLDDETAARVAAGLVDAAGTSPWDGPSPRAWRARVERAGVVLHADALFPARSGLGRAERRGRVPTARPTRGTWRWSTAWSTSWRGGRDCGGAPSRCGLGVGAHHGGPTHDEHGKPTKQRHHGVRAPAALQRPPPDAGRY